MTGLRVSKNVSYNRLSQISPAISSVGIEGRDHGTSSSSPSTTSNELLSSPINLYYEFSKRLTFSSDKDISCLWNRHKDVDKNRPRWIDWVKAFLLVTTVLTLMSAVVILIGAHVQFKRARNAPSTVTYYTTPIVCAAASDAPLARDVFSTYDSASIGTNDILLFLAGWYNLFVNKFFLTPRLVEISIPAHAHSHKVVHCGACAHCSNLNDIGKVSKMCHFQ